MPVVSLEDSVRQCEAPVPPWLVIRMPIQETDLVGPATLTICSNTSRSIPRPSTRRAGRRRGGHEGWTCRRFRRHLSPGLLLHLALRWQDVRQIARGSASRTRRTFPQIEPRSCATPSLVPGQRACQGYISIDLCKKQQGDHVPFMSRARPDSAPRYYIPPTKPI
jgi:hypothetical protein